MTACRLFCVVALLSWPVVSFAATVEDDRDLVTLSLTDVAIADAMTMIAKQKRLNILLSDEVEGNLSLNLYDVPIEKALRAIANAAGYAVERRDNTFFIVEPEKVGLYNTSDLIEVRSFNIHYADWSREKLEVVRESFKGGVILVSAERKPDVHHVYIGTRETIAIQKKEDEHTSVLRAPAWDAHLSNVEGRVFRLFDNHRKRRSGFLLMLETPEWEFLTAVDEDHDLPHVGVVMSRSAQLPSMGP